MAFTPHGMFYLSQEDLQPSMDAIGTGFRGMLGIQNKEEAVNSILQGADYDTPEGRRAALEQIRAIDPEAYYKYSKMNKEYETKTGSTNAYLDAKRERNELALRLQQGYGPMESLADKKAFKKQLIDNGVGDSSVFTSITGEINTLTTAGLAQDKDTDNRQQKLSTQMIKNGVPEIESALVEFEGLAAKYKNDLPGIGIDKWLLSKDAKDMKSAFAQVRNMVLKERSGAAVTNPEFQRLKEEIEGAMYTTDDDAIRWISRIRSTLERVKGTVFAGYGDRVKKAYWDTGTGVKMYEAPERKDMGIKIGDIRNGHKFLGGDPKDSKSWEKQ